MVSFQNSHKKSFGCVFTTWSSIHKIELKRDSREKKMGNKISSDTFHRQVLHESCTCTDVFVVYENLNDTQHINKRQHTTYKRQIRTCRQQNIQHTFTQFIHWVSTLPCFHEKETTDIANPATRRLEFCTKRWRGGKKKRAKNWIWHETAAKLWKKLHETCRKILFWFARLFCLFALMMMVVVVVWWWRHQRWQRWWWQ